MLVIPSLDIQQGRSRLVWWPGASTGQGAPTDRPAAIATALVAQGATALHLVDLDGAARGRPVNVQAIGAVARAVACPLQVAGGIDGPEQIELAFAAGATRVVVPLWAVAEEGMLLAECLRIGRDWLAVGIDARPASLEGFPWRRQPRPTLPILVAEFEAAGVRRFVLSHVAGDAAPPLVRQLAQLTTAELIVAGGVTSVAQVAALRDGGAAGVIVGEALFSGRIELPAALEAAAAPGDGPGIV
jgi:phosphoribosylformimino-5-aminoimidazole carboxamide ribotide isomerase